MAKKSIAQKLRDLLDGSPDESNVPMTSGEIGKVEANKKRKPAAKKRSAKSGAKKKSTKKSKKGKKKSKR
jgi:hypothetical protein